MITRITGFTGSVASIRNQTNLKNTAQNTAQKKQIGFTGGKAGVFNPLPEMNPYEEQVCNKAKDFMEDCFENRREIFKDCQDVLTEQYEKANKKQ